MLYVKPVRISLGLHFNISLYDIPNTSEEIEYMLKFYILVLFDM